MRMRRAVGPRWTKVRALGALCLAPFILGAGLVTPAPDPIAEAASRGDVEAVRTLLGEGADVSAAQADGMTGLHWAAARGDAEMARLLISAGADVTLGTRIGSYTPLHLASRAGYTDVASALVEAGADVNIATTNSGATPLHLAAASAGGGAELVALLIENGADANAREAQAGQTPLMLAAGNGREAAVKELLTRGADPTLTTKVVDVLSRHLADRAADQAFRDELAGFRRSDGGGDDWRPSPAQVQAAIQAQREVAGLEYEVEDKYSLVTTFTRSAGSESVAFRRLPIREVLVGRTGGMTALLHASRAGQIDAAMALLDGGADVNQVSQADGSSPLLIAALNGHYDLALLLLERGADPTLGNSIEGVTPLFAVLQAQWAPRSSHPQPRAAQFQDADHVEVLEALLEAGADPNVPLRTHLWYWEYNEPRIGLDLTGATPFWRAALARDLEAMKLLAAYGADPLAPTTLPEVAMRENRTVDGRQEESSGLPPVPEGAPGFYPIHAAAGGGYMGIGAHSIQGVPEGFLPAVKYLVEEFAADVNVPDWWGYTPLHYAATRGDNELVRYLVEQGADVMALSRLGQSPADMARGGQRGFFMQTRHPETQALLEELGSPLVCLNLHFTGTGDICETAGTTPFEDLYGFPRTPLYQRDLAELYGYGRADDSR